MMAATKIDFERALREVLLEAERSGLDSVAVDAASLHRRVGGYPGNDHRMPVCCSVMRQTMEYTDVILSAPPKGNGASLLIRYDLPRSSPSPRKSVPQASTILRDTTLPSFQRVGAKSNTQVGIDFESAATRALLAAGIKVERNFAVAIGVGALKKKHRFDLGSGNPLTVVECESHRWTTGGNVPSAKLTVWNEAMYYFALCPLGFRRIFFVLRDFSQSRGMTLAEHYLSRYLHLAPEGVEFWEYDEATQSVRRLAAHQSQGF